MSVNRNNYVEAVTDNYGGDPIALRDVMTAIEKTGLRLVLPINHGKRDWVSGWSLKWPS